MSELTRQQTKELYKLIRRQHNVMRFKARRTLESLADELGVSVVTLVSSLRSPKVRGALTPQQIAYARLMRWEYEKHKPEFKEWSQEGIAKRSGVSKMTVWRYRNMILSGASQLQ